jgi:type IV secretory pathway TraG/TraD family ATPase VirD4
VYQDISQLRTTVKAWSTFLQNCGVTLWFGLHDPESCELVQKLSGICKKINRTMNASIDRLTGIVNVSGGGNPFSRPLILAHEATQLTDDGSGMIAWVGGVAGPILAKRRPYWKLSQFRGKFRKNPYVK